MKYKNRKALGLIGAFVWGMSMILSFVFIILNLCGVSNVPWLIVVLPIMVTVLIMLWGIVCIIHLTVTHGWDK